LNFEFKRGARAGREDREGLTELSEPVSEIQQFVGGGDQGGIVNRRGVPDDGIFGPETKKHVMAFQEKHGLKVDGSVGARTWAKLG
jgi:peptidoglycan hydrolase-like protein with peptidoglycan-binding domain